MTNNTLTINRNKILIPLFKGSMIALLISLIGILIFAMFLKFVDINDGWIMPVNQVIKVLSIFFGVKYFLKNCNGAGFLKGLLLGVFYNILAFIIFSILSSTFSIDITFIFDTLFASIIGAICGMICVNIQRS